MAMLMSTSGIQRLPNETLCQVFTDAIEHDFKPYSGSAASAISQTCQRWRNIALHMPKFWSRIHIDDDVHLGNWFLWLERAGNNPLKCSVRLDRGNDYVQDKYSAFLAALAQRQTRWRNMDIHHRAIPYSKESLAFLLDNLPELETFSVRHEIPFVTTSGFEEFSDWYKFEVYQPLFLVPDNGQPIAEKLTSFFCEFNESNYLTREGLLSFLYDCPKLQKLFIRHGRERYNDGDLPGLEDERGFDPTLPVDLTSLQHLVYETPAANGGLIFHVKLPNLRSIELRADIWRSLADQERGGILLTVLEGWRAPIEWASFEGGSFSDAESFRLLRALPRVKCLAFISKTSFPLEALAPQPGADVLCPHLQRLKLTSRGVVGAGQLQHLVDARGPNFRAVVRSTEWNVSQLENIKVELGQHVANGSLQVGLVGLNENLEDERRSWYAATQRRGHFSRVGGN